MKALLTTKEVAEALGVRVKLLEAHRSEMRGLPYIPIGKAIRYLYDDINRASSFGLPVAAVKVRQRRRKRVRRPVYRGMLFKGGR